MATRPDTPAPAFRAIRRRRVAADVIAAVQEMIADGRLRAGQKLPSERELAESLGVSRPTVREAMRSLAHSGLVEVRHGAGTFVSSLDAAELMRPLRFALSLSAGGHEQLFEVRLLLEPGAARAAATRRDEAQLAAMRACIEASRADGVGVERLAALDGELHALIAAASRNPLLVNLMESIAALGVASRERTLELPGVPARAHADHERIVGAIAAGDADGAETAMRDHLDGVAAEARQAGLPGFEPTGEAPSR